MNRAAAEHGYSDADIAAMVDRPRQHVSAQMNGERGWTAEQLMLIPDDLFDSMVDGLRDARAKRRVK